MKHPKFNVPAKVYLESNPGRMIHDLYSEFENQTYRKSKALVTKYINNLTPADLEKMNKSSQYILEANKEYYIPKTQITHFYVSYPGLVKLFTNFLDQDFHSALKSKVTGM